MPRRPGVLLLSAVAIGLLSGAARRRAVTPSLPPAVQYLGFYAGGSTPEINAAPATLQTKAQIEASWAPIINAIGEKGDGVHQQLGFWIGPLGWDLTDAQEKQLIDDAFAVAEKQNVAVGFHIDDSMFWNRRTDLWSDTNNVEWSDWKGTVVPHRIVGWVGFTLGPKSFLSTSVYTILSAHGSPSWGISESDMTFTGSNGVATADDNMEQYLGGVFNHGGVYVDIFGWGGRDSSGALSPFAQADEAPSSIAAYQKFLRGDVLSEQ